MDKYISAEELKKHFPQDEDWDYPVNTNSLVCEPIDAQPTIDVDYERGFIEGYTKAESDIFHGGKYAPVKHARWYYPPSNSYRPFGPDTVQCPECGFFTTWDCGYHYCPNCGADMREVEE